MLGANDGLVSNMSLVMGVAGAAAAEQTILLAGLAGLIAGACSMAMGEWLSVNSARELAEQQIALEASELEMFPEQEREELILIYQSKGLSEAEATSVADRLLGQDGAAVDTLAREELGIDPKELGGSAWVAGASSFMLFAIGAIFPVAPFFFLTGATAVIASLASGRRGAGPDRLRHVAVHRARRRVLGGPPDPDRLCRRRGHLRVGALVGVSLT